MRGRERPGVFCSLLREFLVIDQSIYVSWDGYYLGDLVPDGVYIYIIFGNYTSSTKGWQRLDKSGTLLVLDGGR